MERTYKDCKRCSGDGIIRDQRGVAANLPCGAVCYSCDGKGKIYTAEARAHNAVVVLRVELAECVEVGKRCRARLNAAEGKEYPTAGRRRRRVASANRDMDRSIEQYRDVLASIRATEALIASGDRITHKAIKAVCPFAPRN